MVGRMSGTTGPFGGVLSLDNGVTREVLTEALAAALVATQGRAYTLPVEAADAEMARVVFFRFEAEGVRYEGDVSRLQPWRLESPSTAEALAALASVGRCLGRLHERGIVHGDLRAEMLRVDEAGKVTVLVPAHASAPGAVLKARLHPGGAPAIAVGFAAPEAVEGAEVTAATDVYGLAAIAYATLTGQAPLGQVERTAARSLSGSGALVDGALRQVPPMRPSMETLVNGLAKGAASWNSEEALHSSAYRTAPHGQAATPGVVGAGAPDISPVLVLVLVIGGLCAFVGAVLLVVAVGDAVGAAGRVATLLGVAALSWGAGALAGRYRIDAGVTVGRGLAGLFATVAVAYAFSQLDEVGRLGLLIGLTTGAFVGGAMAGKRGAPLGGVVLLALGSQLLWVVGAQIISMSHVGDGPGVIAVLAAVVSLVTYGLALLRRTGPFGVLAAMDVAVLCASLGAYLRTGTVMGPATFALGVAGLYALLAQLAAWREAKSTALPMTLGAAGAAGLSALAGGVVMVDHWDTHGLLGAAWPFVVAAAAAVAVVAKASSPLKDAAAFVVGAIVVLAPTSEAMLRDELGFTLFAVGVGGAVLAAALWRPELKERGEVRAEALLAGLFGVMASPDARLLHAIGEGRGEWLAGDSGGRWVVMGAVSVGLLVMSYAVTTRVSRARYRLLEVAALVQWFGVLTLQVLAAHREAAPAALVLGSAGGLVALAVGTRRAAVLLISVAALIVNLWVQYFARLEGVFPLSVRLVGFGVGLLVGGVLYEQQVKQRLSRLKDWG